MGKRYGGAVRAALDPRSGASSGEGNAFADLHDRYEAATAARTPEEEHAYEVLKFRAERAAIVKAKDDAAAAQKLARREAELAADKAKGAKKRLTFRRTMNMRSQSVRWRRITAMIGRGNDGALDARKLDVLFRKYARGKDVLDQKGCQKLFKGLNGIDAPADALEHIDADVGIRKADLAFKVAEYNEYMKARKKLRLRQREWIEKYRRFDHGGKGILDEADVHVMICCLCDVHLPDARAMRLAFLRFHADKSRSIELADCPDFVDMYQSNSNRGRCFESALGPVYAAIAWCLIQAKALRSGHKVGAAG
ncbi:hypothetical protein M885DRAFT_613972 [Pelagophyceae sp. CCMP2097]|nr:hypothetical protein M885DRAFT_613972 [Pelagophyceae sp. CCMP2097]